MWLHGNGFFISFWVFIAQTRRLWAHSFSFPHHHFIVVVVFFPLFKNKLNLVLQSFQCLCVRVHGIEFRNLVTNSTISHWDLRKWIMTKLFPDNNTTNAAPTEHWLYFGYMCDMFSVSTLQSIIQIVLCFPLHSLKSYSIVCQHQADTFEHVGNKFQEESIETNLPIRWKWETTME